MSNFRRGIAGRLNASSGGYVLPKTYQRVEYLESSGTQYISLDATASSKYVYTKIVLMITGTSSGYLDGARGKSPTWFCSSQYDTTTNLTFGWGAGWGAAIDCLSKNIKHSISLYMFVNAYPAVCVDDVWHRSESSGSGGNVYVKDFDDGIKISLFARTFYDGTVVTGAGRIYEYEIGESAHEPSIKCVPCYRKSDNEPGMYDLVNNVFYTNIGSGTFVLGPNA